MSIDRISGGSVAYDSSIAPAPEPETEATSSSSEWQADGVETQGNYPVLPDDDLSYPVPILGDDGSVSYPEPNTDPPVIGTNGIPILD